MKKFIKNPLCEKCANSSITFKYIQNRKRGVESEEIQHHCLTCGYTWCTLPNQVNLRNENSGTLYSTWDKQIKKMKKEIERKR